MQDHPQALERRLQYLQCLDVSPELPPEQQLLLAILRQAVIDYFGDDPVERLTAARYFAESPLYRLTLKLFKLPPDTLPFELQLDYLKGEIDMTPSIDDSERLKLETLVRELSGAQLKVVLTMGLMADSASAGRISKQCRLHRGTVQAALVQLAGQGLVTQDDSGRVVTWSLPEGVRALLDEVWRE